MKVEPVLKSDAKTAKDILIFLKEHKKLFLQKVKLEWGNRSIYTKCSTTGWQLEIKKQYMISRPSEGDELLAFGRALQSWVRLEQLPKEELFQLLQKLQRRYGEKVNEKWLIKKKRPEWFNYTAISVELYQRGFIHVLDFINIHKDTVNNIDKKKPIYIIMSEKALVMYPKVYQEREEAEDINETYGMPEITKVFTDEEVLNINPL